MMGAPWKVFFKDDKNIIIDVDGNIDVDGHVARPFPCSITNAEICNSGLIATWVDLSLIHI